jgi:hypothetical protein
MFGSIKCICGKFMQCVGAEYATYHSGRRQDYRCRRCGAEAHIWSRHGVDDEPVGGVIIDRGGRERRVVFYGHSGGVWGYWGPERGKPFQQ